MPPKKSSPRRGKAKSDASSDQGTVSYEDDGAIPETQCRSTQVVFEILPTLSPFEPTARESLLRMQEKCDQETLNLYDMSAGKSASVGELEKDQQDAIMEDLKSYTSEKKRVPLWMRDINRSVFETLIDYEKTKDTYKKEVIYGLNGQPKCTERDDVLIIRPTSLPEEAGHSKIQTPGDYQLYNGMSKNALISDRLERFGKTFDTIRYDIKREVRFRTMEEKREDYRRHELRPSLVDGQSHAKEFAHEVLDQMKPGSKPGTATAEQKKVQLEADAVTTVPFTQAYLDGLVTLKDKIQVGAADR
ncbi:unnamed protein product [Amoebophrya sp. A120]|nr:unnamed protein product [Amoebophrya sp. A120]|eukprot:GSA120T00024543001.1